MQNCNAMPVPHKEEASSDAPEILEMESVVVLTSGLIHDLNNVLTAVLGNIELLKMYSNLEDEMHEILEDADNTGQRIKLIIQQLRIIMESVRSVRQVIPVWNLVQMAVAHFSHFSDLQFEITMPADLGNVEVDRRKLRLALIRILENSRQAMSDGGVIRITACNETVMNNSRIPLPEGSYVKLSISDHGEGIKPENMEKVFDICHTTRAKEYGFGLPVVQQIIKQHKGHINISSSQGEFTEVEIYLPAV